MPLLNKFAEQLSEKGWTLLEQIEKKSPSKMVGEYLPSPEDVDSYFWKAVIKKQEHEIFIWNYIVALPQGDTELSAGLPFITGVSTVMDLNW